MGGPSPLPDGVGRSSGLGSGPGFAASPAGRSGAPALEVALRRMDDSWLEGSGGSCEAPRGSVAGSREGRGRARGPSPAPVGRGRGEPGRPLAGRGWRRSGGRTGRGQAPSLSGGTGRGRGSRLANRWRCPGPGGCADISGGASGRSGTRLTRTRGAGPVPPRDHPL